MNCHEFSNDLDLWKFQIFIIIKIRCNEIIRFWTKNQKICVTTYIFFRLRHPKHEKRWRRAKRVPKSFTAMDGIEQGHRRGSSIRCLRGEVRRVTSAFIHTTSCARARALAPTFTSSLLSYADIYICNIYMYYIDTHTQVNTGHQRSLLSPTFLQTSSRPFSRVFARAPSPHLFLDPISRSHFRKFTTTWTTKVGYFIKNYAYRLYISIKLEKSNTKNAYKVAGCKGYKSSGEAKKTVYRSVFLFLLSIRRAVSKTKI